MPTEDSMENLISRLEELHVAASARDNLGPPTASESRTQPTIVRAWEESMTGHVQQCIEKYCELANIPENSVPKNVQPQNEVNNRMEPIKSVKSMI